MHILPLTTWSYVRIFPLVYIFRFCIVCNTGKIIYYFGHAHAKYTRPYFQRPGIEARAFIANQEVNQEEEITHVNYSEICQAINMYNYKS